MIDSPHTSEQPDEDNRDLVAAPLPSAANSWRGPVAGGGLALVILWVLGLGSCTPGIEDDLTDRSVAALTSAGLDRVGVDFSGRDATLRGSMDEATARRAHRIVRGLEGVRHVNDRFTLTPSSDSSGDGASDGKGSSAAMSGSPLRFVVGVAGNVTLTGMVRTEADHEAAIAAAKAALGPDVTVVDRIVVDASGSSVNAKTDPVLAALGADGLLTHATGTGSATGTGPGQSSGFDVSTDAEGNLVVTGTVASEADRAALIAAIEASTTAKVIDKLTVETASTASSTTASSTTAETTTTVAPETTSTTLPPEAAKAQVEINALLAGKVIEFQTGSAQLTAAGNAVLDEITPLLAEAGTTKVQIVGNTDNTGNPAGNQLLSVARAETVRAALVGRGIAADRLSTIGYGGDRPIADNATSEGRQRNRRIEFVLGA
jgi:outer membrane protein OmpA-like peptidoglycan-associated protein